MKMWSALIGKKIVALRGYGGQLTRLGRPRAVELSFVLFDDQETFLELSAQDYYTYHDCSDSARHIAVRCDAAHWLELFDKVGNYVEADASMYEFGC